MRMIERTIKFNGGDVNLAVGLGSTDLSVGRQEEIDAGVEIVKKSLINPHIDNEIRRFQYDSNGNFYFSFYFYKNNIYRCSFYYADFSEDELYENNPKFANSFYIMEVYDTYDPFNQVKISTNYVSKILTGSQNKTPKYLFPNNSSFNDLYVPQSFIDSNWSDSIVTGYSKFYFYNAKKGRIAVFYNFIENSDLVNTMEKLYFKIEIDVQKRTWRFIRDSSSNNVARELPPNNIYVQKINNTFNTISVKKQKLPNGNRFNKDAGDYVTE